MCKESLTKQSYHRVCFVGFSRWTWACQQTDVPSWFELSVYAEWSFWAIYILSLIYSYWAFMFHPHSVLLFSRSHPASLLPLFVFFFFPLSSSCAFPPFCYHSNRRAALHWKGHTPRGPPLSSRSEGRMRRRKELREYVRTRSPLHLHPPPLTLSLLTFDPFSFTLCSHRRSCEAAWECCATDFWPTKLYMARVSAALLCHYRASPFLLGDSIDTPS